MLQKHWPVNSRENQLRQKRYIRISRTNWSNGWRENHINRLANTVDVTHASSINSSPHVEEKAVSWIEVDSCCRPEKLDRSGLSRPDIDVGATHRRRAGCMRSGCWLEAESRRRVSQNVIGRSFRALFASSRLCVFRDPLMFSAYMPRNGTGSRNACCSYRLQRPYHETY